MTTDREHATSANHPTGDGPPAIDAPAAVTARAALRRLWPVVRPYRWRIALLVVLAAFVPAIEAATIWLYARLIDDVLTPRALAPLPGIAAAYLVLTLLAGAVGFGERLLAAWTGEKLLLDLRLRLFRHLLTLPPAFFHTQRLGDLLARIDDDADGVADALVSGVAEAVGNLLKLLVFAGALVLIDWRLALVALVVAPPCWFVARRLAARIRAIAREQRQWDGAAASVAEEILANTTLVQLHNRQADEVERFARAARGDFAAQIALERLRAALSPLVSLLELAGVLAIVAAGAWALADGRITLGALLAFLAYLSQLYGPVRALSRLAGDIAAAAANAERVLDLLPADEPEVATPARGLRSGWVRGEVAIDDVTFRYPGRPDPVLDCATLRITAGERVAIVGPSGSGKSTLVSLLLRFAEPETGRLAIDGHDLRDLDLPALRDAVAVVMQETLLLDGTIRDNIAYGKPDATDDEIRAAARVANLHDLVAALPDGYATRVGQRGRTLSGGQRQRVAIARALLRDAPILILDEPTTGLDEDTARRVLEPLRRLMLGRTTLLLSHDPLVVAEADRVVAIEGGRLVPRETAAPPGREPSGDRGAGEDRVADAPPPSLPVAPLAAHTILAGAGAA